MSETAASTDTVLTPVTQEEAKGAEGTTETTTETKPEETKTEEKVEDKDLEQDKEFSKKFNWLAKKERKIREDRAQAEALKAELESIRKENEALKAFKESLKTKPLATLKGEGLSFEDLTAQALSGDRENDRLLALQNEMDALKGELTNYRKLNEEKEKAAQAAQEKHAEESFRAQIGAFLDTSDKHELARTFQATDLVYDVIETQFEETGRLMSVDEAADLVEQYLEKKTEEDAERLRKTNKYKTKLVSKFALDNQAESPTAKAEVKERSTLTNESAPPRREDRAMSNAERLKAAAEMLKFT